MITPRPAEERYWAFVEVAGPDDCWPWKGSLNPDGYGRFTAAPGQRPKQSAAHRFGYEFQRGPIPRGLVIDHLCRNKRCQNAAHLEPVTHRENVLRGIGPTAMKARQDRCVNGHPYEPANFYTSKTGFRICRTCHTKRVNEYRQRKKAALAQRPVLVRS
jgi:hypothetical protein